MRRKTELRSRFFTPPSGSFFLFGPRGTGKTTWLQRSFPDALFVDVLLPEVHRTFGARPERLAELVRGNPDRTTVVVDEVQRLPALLDVVHSLMESESGRRFVLTGSSARKLRRAGVNLLAGRATYRTLHPFMLGEVPDTTLGRALDVGLLPLVLGHSDPSDALRAYAALYLREEVQIEGLVRQIADFARFLEAMSFSHGAALNIADVARECQVERKTAAGYLQVLEDLLLGFQVHVFTRRAQRAVTAHPKFYFFDAGVYLSLRPRGPLDRPEEMGGPALEGLVAQHLRAWIAYGHEHDCELTFWRTRGGVEVDFVVYGACGFWAIEVKNTAQIRPPDLRGLRAFRQDYPEASLLLLYRGRDRLRIGDVLCVPVDEFLHALHPARGLLAGFE
ncbi:MAG: AAA family ATPase [Acidobacteriota bacterium]